MDNQHTCYVQEPLDLITLIELSLFFINWYKVFFYYFFNPRCVCQSIVVTVILLCFAGVTSLISHELLLVAAYMPSLPCVS